MRLPLGTLHGPLRVHDLLRLANCCQLEFDNEMAGYFSVAWNDVVSRTGVVCTFGC